MSSPSTPEYVCIILFSLFPHLTHPVPVTNQGTALCLVHQLARIDMMHVDSSIETSIVSSVR